MRQLLPRRKRSVFSVIKASSRCLKTVTCYFYSLANQAASSLTRTPINLFLENMTIETPEHSTLAPAALSKSVSVSPVYQQVMSLNAYQNPHGYIEYAVGRIEYALRKRSLSHDDTEHLVAYPEPRIRIIKELGKCQRLGQTPDGKSIFLFEYQRNSSVMRELGRLRALTFKVVGEGTKQLRDTDRFDQYYKHIVLWDDSAAEIVGSYRIGEAHLYTKNHAKPLYTEDLFDYQPDMRAIFPKAIELGRSFIQPKYWSKRGLDYLWMGIGAYLSANPKIQYLFGAVSISNEFPNLAKHQIVACFQHHFQPENHHALAKPKLPFKVDRGVLENYRDLHFDESLVQLKHTLKKQNVVLPTLYKHYADLCEARGTQFIDFNVDPKFSHCIDGLILVDLSYIKDKKKRRYLDPHTASKH